MPRKSQRSQAAAIDSKASETWPSSVLAMVERFDHLADDQWVSVAVLAALTDTSIPTVWRWAKRHLIPQPYKLADNTTRWLVRDLRHHFQLLQKRAKAAAEREEYEPRSDSEDPSLVYGDHSRHPSHVPAIVWQNYSCPLQAGPATGANCEFSFENMRLRVTGPDSELALVATLNALRATHLMRAQWHYVRPRRIAPLHIRCWDFLSCDVTVRLDPGDQTLQAVHDPANQHLDLSLPSTHVWFQCGLAWLGDDHACCEKNLSNPMPWRGHSCACVSDPTVSDDSPSDAHGLESMSPQDLLRLVNRMKQPAS